MEIKSADEILKKYIGETMSQKGVLDAMKEYASQFIDLAAEEAEIDMIHTDLKYSDENYTNKSISVDRGYEECIDVDFSVNKESILKVKQLIK